MFSFFTGKAPVSRIFWLGLVVFSIPIGFVIEYLMTLINTTDAPRIRMQGTMLLVITSALFTLYAAFLTKGIFKAAHRNRAPRFWGWAAISITALNVVISAHFTFDPWAYQRALQDGLSRVPPSEELMTEVQSVQALLPRKLSKSMEVESVELTKRALIFAVKAKGNLHDERVAATEAAVKKILTAQGSHCAELQTAFEQGLWTAIYEIRFDNAVLTARLEPQQCAEILSAQATS